MSVQKATFRLRLMAVFGAALLALLAVLVVSAMMGVTQGRSLDDVQGRLVPKAELGPRVEAAFEQLTRGLQDSVAAQDADALEATIERRSALFELLGRAAPALRPEEAAAVRWAVQDYYDGARDVSRRMLAGESSDALLRDMSRMQLQQRRALELIKRTTAVDRQELSAAFASVRQVGAQADRLRLGMAGAGILVVFGLAYWGGGSLLQSVKKLSDGLARFGTGDFATPIPVESQDEIASVAEQANQMAASLQRLSDARDRDAWLKSGQSGLAEQLRGELEPDEVAARALAYLAQRTGALVGALYVRGDDGALELAASYGEATGAAGRAERGFEPSREGLVGQALANAELLVIDEPPAGYLKVKSGLGEAEPAQVLLLPLVHFGAAAGVVELALLKPASPEARELLLGSRSHLVVALQAARAGAARKRLLTETQAQAERLAAQEEELRLSNQELLAQQEELRRANQELEQQRAALATQNEQLEQARGVLAANAEELKRVSAYKSQFLANMSHELRTPLNSMLLLSHLMAENEAGNLTAKQVEHLRTVHGAGQDLLSLINEVLDLSKIEAGRQDVTLEDVDPSHFSAFMKRLFEATAQQRRLSFEVSVDPSAPPLLRTDRQRVERILTNLVGNAIKFTDRGGVSVWIGRPRGAATNVLGVSAIAFEVTDTGVGIPEGARQRVFSPFEQVAGQSRHAQRGTGLGLTIARESARLLGGELLLASSSSAGSTFVCVVPERADDADSLTSSPVREVADDSAQLDALQPHLLIVEDDRVLAEQLVDIAHARQLKVVVVGSGREALARARQRRPLGIILDVRLPDLDGWSVLESLKRDEATRSIPVHFVSGVDSPQRGLALGAVGYLVKPASHADLADMIHTLVPNAEPGRSVLVVEDDSTYGATLVQLLAKGGFNAHHVQTGALALDALASGNFGGVILDLGLPDVDGLSFLRTLRQRPDLGSPSVVIHTGRALSKAETRELEAYAEAVVLKDGRSAERLLEEARLFVRHVAARTGVNRSSEAPKPDVSLRGVKLLLAEDDMRTVYSLSALLRGKGAEVVTVETGREALQALSEHRDVRCVLMDVMMPEMDGYEAMRLLRQREELAQLPVIALTAKAMKGERERCLEAGATDYLPKPIDGEKLLDALRQALGAS